MSLPDGAKQAISVSSQHWIWRILFQFKDSTGSNVFTKLFFFRFTVTVSCSCCMLYLKKVSICSFLIQLLYFPIVHSLLFTGVKIYQRSLSFRVLYSILAVPRTLLFWTEFSEVVLGICRSHTSSSIDH